MTPNLPSSDQSEPKASKMKVQSDPKTMKIALRAWTRVKVDFEGTYNAKTMFFLFLNGLKTKAIENGFRKKVSKKRAKTQRKRAPK